MLFSLPHSIAKLVAVIVGAIACAIMAASVSALTHRGSSQSFAVGLNCGTRHAADFSRCRAAGARLARVEFSVAATPASMDRVFAAYAARGIKIQPLAGFYGRLPTAAEAELLRGWALRFGPRGMFWKKRKHRSLAVTLIEFGNETSYGYQYGDGPSDASYVDRARTYAVRAHEAANALRGTGVGLLVQGDDGGSKSTAWLDHVFEAAPALHSLASGWTVHPYGPDGVGKIDRMLSSLRARRTTRAQRIFVTEWGISSDDGRSLSDNYGYPANMTYEHAAATFRDVLQLWSTRYGSGLAQVMVYQAADQRPPGTSSDRERYFGVLRNNGSEKGAYSREVRSTLLTAASATRP